VNVDSLFYSLNHVETNSLGLLCINYFYRFLRFVEKLNHNLLKISNISKSMEKSFRK
jgi:hypothetical protein